MQSGEDVPADLRGPEGEGEGKEKYPVRPRRGDIILCIHHPR